MASKIIGIDLGTTNSCVAIVEGGEPKVIINQDGSRTTPSVVAFLKGGEEVLVGGPAKRQAVTNPENTVYSAKRLVGKRFEEVSGETESLAYKVVKSVNSDAWVEVEGKQYSPQQVLAYVLMELKKAAEDYLGSEVTEAVITVPAYFNDSQRQATKDAGKIAGLDVKRIINGSTAAALAYGFDKKENGLIVIYDLGGGNFNVSVLEVGNNVIEVKSTNGNTSLGGDNFDNRLVDYIISEFKKDSGIDLGNDKTSEQGKMALQRLREAAEKAKIELSNTEETEINLPYITADASGPKNLVLKVTSSKFEQLIEDIVKDTLKPCEKALRDAGLRPGEIAEVVLVGGSTRIPLVQKVVTDFFTKEPSRGINPDEVVAMGTALQAGVLGGDVTDMLLLDVVPLSLGFETQGGFMTTVIERNTTIPTKKSHIFTTAEDNQNSVEIHVLQGERQMAADNRTLARFFLSGIPAARRWIPQIEVTFDIDANGILHVSAKDLATQKEEKIEVKASGGLSDDEIDSMAEEAKRMSEKDKEKKEQIKKRNQLDELAYRTDKTFQEVEQALEEGREALKSDDPGKVDLAIEKITAVFHKLGELIYKKQQEEASAGAGESGVEDQDMASKIIGIDLGTTNSCVAIVEGGEPKVIINEEGTKTTPSVVAFLRGGGVLVGGPAKRQAVTNPENTVYSVKRLMGRRFEEVSAEANRLSYNVVNHKSDAWVEVGGNQYSPPQVSAHILMKLKKAAENCLGSEVTEAVITVPAYFNDRQRQATKDAGKIAGLEVKRIINEPTAAALAYGLDKKKEGMIVVYDLRSKTFDVSVLEVGNNVIEVKSTNGDTQLGGDDFDNRLVDYIISEFKKDSGIDLGNDKTSEQGKIALRRLREAAEKAKIELSNTIETEINLPFITADASGPKHLVLKVTRSKFEQLIEDLVKGTLKPCEQALRDAGLRPGEIAEVVLVGGSTRIPLVQKVVTDFFGKEPSRGINPDEVVAMGAAIQAGVLGGDVTDMLFLDVVPLSLGFEAPGGVMTTIIERNTPIPIKKSRIFTTAEDNQNSIEVHVLQGERPMAADNRTLGRFVLSGIPAARKGIPQIEVTFDIDANGILNVSAKDTATQKEQKIKIEASSGLSSDEIDSMVEEAEKMSEKDKEKSEQVQKRNQLDELVYRTDKIEVTFDIDADGALHVSAKDKETQKKRKVTIGDPGGLSDDEIESLIRKAKKMSDKDKEKLKQVQKRNQLDELVYRTDKIVQELEQVLEEGRKALKSDNPDKIDLATEKTTAVSLKLAELMYKKQ